MSLILKMIPLLFRNFILQESIAGTGMSEVTCLVVGGIYDGDLQETYYRLDFFDPLDGVTYIGYSPESPVCYEYQFCGW